VWCKLTPNLSIRTAGLGLPPDKGGTPWKS